MTIKITLGETLKNNKNLTRNKIAVHAKIRPATLHDLVNNNGKVKSLSFETLNAMLDSMNKLDNSRNYDISAVIIDQSENNDD